jgi:Hemolysin coregulated protein Hcp (TssD)
MSFIAKLHFEGEDEEGIDVFHCGFRFSQTTDATGKPTAIPEGGSINLLIEGTGDTDIFDWMVNPTQTKNGDITFYRRDTMSKLKKLEFTDAHCVDYYETFDHTGESPLQIQLTLSARELKLNDSEYKNNWPQ